MNDKEQLANVLDDLIDQNAEQAAVNFHDYLRNRMQDVIGGQNSNTEQTETSEE